MSLSRSPQVNHRHPPGHGQARHPAPGMGAVATTFIAGVEAIRKGISKPIGSLTQMGTIRLGKRTDARTPLIKTSCRSPSSTTSCSAAGTSSPTTPTRPRRKAGVLSKEHLAELKDFLSTIKPMTAVFEQAYVKKLTATHVKKGKNKLDLAEQVMEDIKEFKKTNNCDRLVTVWCGSTEVYRRAGRRPRLAGDVRDGPRGERSRDRAVADLRLRGAQAGRALRQRRAEPDRRHAGAAWSWPSRTTCRSAARTSRPARR